MKGQINVKPRGIPLINMKFPDITCHSQIVSDKTRFTEFLCSDCRTWKRPNQPDIINHLKDYEFPELIAQERTDFLWTKFRESREQASITRDLLPPETPDFIPMTDEEWKRIKSLPCVEDVEPCTEVISTRVPRIIRGVVESDAAADYLCMSFRILNLEQNVSEIKEGMRFFNEGMLEHMN